ncbi:Meromycolate extension acyl carrier protein (plasmid) [Streptomyces sp. YIM 121038]|uniref:phosphopantetheine-binding protein n=1 Tax=Streptomyces sp. YIM 121038 TaxID=2136401 RepID=UPI00110FFFE4|nr:phosphopantetheine-binding protein [Streptomyces sp. YIM 121038]QCX82940.1 Meromycolate extension acyl carrier protein [Streptomyces sp. YIM 121038]
MNDRTYAGILADVSEIIYSLNEVATKEVSESDSLQDDLDLDSLPLVEMACAAEDKFGIAIPQEDLFEFRTVADVTSYVHKRLDRA